MVVIERHAIIDDVLGVWAEAMGDARAAYAGHAYRVFNYARALYGPGASDDALAAASAFHDIGIWTDGTWDYLPPSVARAREYLRTRAPELPEALVVRAINDHHRLRPVRDGSDAGAVEAFRRADMVDVAGAAIRFGMDAGFVREVRHAFPYAGFHGTLLRAAAPWIVRHPLRPMPMLRF